MIIQYTAAAFAPTATGNLSGKRHTSAEIPTNNAADTPSISQEARDLLSSEAANGASVQASGTYPLNGLFYRVEDVVKNKGGPLTAIKMTGALADEVKLREQQDEARRSVNFDYAEAHRHQPAGQVLLNGQLAATVFDDGSYESPHAIANLSDRDASPADRLAEIAHAVDGKIIHSDLLPTMGGWSGSSAPESMLPPVTTRSLMEIFQQEILPAKEKAIAEWEAQTGKTYPRPT